jgi:hypothetical protein
MTVTRNKDPELDEQAIVKAYVAGDPARVIAQRCGISMGSVYTCLTAYGIKRRKRGPQPLPASQLKSHVYGLLRSKGEEIEKRLTAVETALAQIVERLER